MSSSLLTNTEKAVAATTQSQSTTGLRYGLPSSYIDWFCFSWATFTSSGIDDKRPSSAFPPVNPHILLHCLLVVLISVLYSQGTYNNEGQIVVLCAYLGQLTEIRKVLTGLVTTLIDSRDAEGLADAGKEITSTCAEQVKVSSRVLLRTVDNYQVLCPLDEHDLHRLSYPAQFSA